MTVRAWFAPDGTGAGEPDCPAREAVLGGAPNPRADCPDPPIPIRDT